jgi:hypothetical protein
MTPQSNPYADMRRDPTTDRNSPPDVLAAMRSVLDLPGVTAAWSIRLADGRVLEHQASASMEAGSAFKAVVAACCRLAERGSLSWASSRRVSRERSSGMEGSRRSRWRPTSALLDPPGAERRSMSTQGGSGRR